MGEKEPERRLPEIGEKPIVPRRKRWVVKFMVGSTLACAIIGGGIKLLQRYEPGPKPVYIPPPAVTSLAELAIKKGFPEQCLMPNYDDLFGADPTGPTPDPNVEKLDCIYAGHADGQPEPAPSKVCEVILERNTWSDPYNFGFNVVGTDGKQIYLGKGSEFKDIPATPGVPAACVQVNITYP